MQAPAAWSISTGSSSVVIAIIDTGVDLPNLEFAGKIVTGCDFVNRDDSAQDDNGHGTHVAGIAAALGNNGSHMAGISWGARVMPLKVLSSEWQRLLQRSFRRHYLCGRPRRKSDQPKPRWPLAHIPARWSGR